MPEGKTKMRESFIEKRKHLRFDCRIPMRYRKIETNAQEFKGGLMKDIGEGGVKMTINEFLSLNLNLAMEIPLTSGARPVEGISRVAWVKKSAFSEQYDIGIEFVNLNQGDEAQISKFVFKKRAGKVLL